MSALGNLIGKSELSSGESLPLEENEATLAEFYLDVEQCSKHSSTLTKNLRDWKGILENARARGGATPSVLQELRSSAAHQIEKEDDEARRLGRMKKNALVLEKHLVRLSRLCMSQEEIIHNLRQSERQRYLKGEHEDGHGQYLLEDSGYLHRRLQDLTDALKETRKEAKGMKAKVSTELERRYALERDLEKARRQVQKAERRVADRDRRVADLQRQAEAAEASAASRAREAEAEVERLRGELSALEQRGLVDLGNEISAKEESRQLQVISLQARMRDAHLDRSRLERRLRLEDEEDSRLTIQARIGEIDQDRARLRSRLGRLQEENEGEEVLVIQRCVLTRQAAHIHWRVQRRALRENFSEWKELCLGYKRAQQQEPAFDLSQLAGSLTDYRFITMKHFSWWARQVEISRQIRHKARLVRQLVSRNNMRASVRAWAMHCGTLRHRRARLVKINSYFESRAVRISFQKWKAVAKRIKRLLHPDLVQKEETSDRLRKLQLTRWALRHFREGTRESRHETRAATALGIKVTRILKAASVRRWKELVAWKRKAAIKEERFAKRRQGRLLRLWLREAKESRRIAVQVGRLELKIDRRVQRECLWEWSLYMRMKMEHRWILETWGKRQRERRMRSGLEAFKREVHHHLRGSKFAVMLKNLNIQNLRARSFYRWAATTAANVLSFAIQKVHDHLTTIDFGLLSAAVQYDEDDPKMQDVMVIAQKIDENLDAVKAALKDAHAVFREVRRTRRIVGEYGPAVAGVADGAMAPGGQLHAEELGLSPGAQAILLKRRVLNVKGQLNNYKLSKVLMAQKMLGIDDLPSLRRRAGFKASGDDGEEGEEGTPPRALRASTDLLKRSLDTAVAKLQSRRGAAPGASSREVAAELSSQQDVKDMYSKVTKIRRNLESELEKSSKLASYFMDRTPSRTPVQAQSPARDGFSTPPRSGTPGRPWRPPGITPSPGWKNTPEENK